MECELYFNNVFFLNTQNVVCGLATWATSAGTAESFSSFPPDQLSENLHFNKILRSSVCILKFEKDFYRPRKVDFCCTLWTSSIFSTLLCGEFPTLSTASKRWNSETGLPSLPCNLGIHHLGSFDQAEPLVQRHIAEEAGTVWNTCLTR